MLIYIDESGSLNSNAVEPYFVLSAVAINEKLHKDLSSAIYNLKQRYFSIFSKFKNININIQDIELKGKKLLTKTILKIADKIHFDMLNELFNIFQAYRITVFGIVADRPKEEIPDGFLSDPYIELLQRINEFMEEFHKNEFAFCIFDEIDRETDFIRAKNFEKFIFKSSLGKKLNHIIDTITFSNSLTTVGTQLADIVSTTIYQQFTKNQYIMPFYNVISALQYRSIDPDKVHLSKGIRYVGDITKILRPEIE